MRFINRIVIHASATSHDMDIGMNEIRRWHMDKGWRDIGYNGVIRRNGSFEVGRDLDADGDFDEEVGAHAYGFNAKSIGICLVGGADFFGHPANNFTPVQFNVLELLLRGYLSKYDSITSIVGHRDLPDVKKECPCFDVNLFLQDRKILSIG